MKTQINEIRRMQQLAGILKEEEVKSINSVEDLGNIMGGIKDAFLAARTMYNKPLKNKETAVWLMDPRVKNDSYLQNLTANEENLQKIRDLYGKQDLTQTDVLDALRNGNHGSRAGKATNKEELKNLIQNYDKVYLMSYDGKIIELTK